MSKRKPCAWLACLLAIVLVTGAVVNVPASGVDARRMPTVTIAYPSLECDADYGFCARWMASQPEVVWVPFKGDADGYYAAQKGGNEVRVYNYVDNSRITGDIEYLVNEVMRDCVNEWHVALTSGEIHLTCTLKGGKVTHGKIVVYGTRVVAALTTDVGYTGSNFIRSVGVPSVGIPPSP